MGDYKVYQIHSAPFEVPKRFTVLKALGVGAYGLVCSAIDGDSGEKVAIKKCRDVEDGKRVLRDTRFSTSGFMRSCS